MFSYELKFLGRGCSFIVSVVCLNYCGKLFYHLFCQHILFQRTVFLSKKNIFWHIAVLVFFMNTVACVSFTFVLVMVMWTDIKLRNHTRVILFIDVSFYKSIMVYKKWIPASLPSNIILFKWSSCVGFVRKGVISKQ